MKEKLMASVIIGGMIAAAILIRPQIVKTQSGPNTLWQIESATGFPNGLLSAGSGFGINANQLGGLGAPIFQKKIVTKQATWGPTTTTALSSSPDNLTNATVTFSSSEITDPTTLVVLWSGSFKNNVVDSGIQTRLYLDGNYTGRTTHITQPNPAEAWSQHSGNAILPVNSGSHTVSLKWNVFNSGSTGSATDPGVITVVAIPQ